MKTSLEANLEQKLLSKGLIKTEDLGKAKSESKKRGVSLIDSFIDLDILPESQAMQLVSEELQVPHVTLKGKQVSPEVLELLPARIAHYYGIMPLNRENDALVIAMSDPQNLQKVDDIRLFLQKDITPVLSSQKDIKECQKKHYGVGADTLEELARETGLAGAHKTVEAGKDLKTLVEDASVVKFVNQILLEALESRATDIHIEPYENDLRIRRRIDGILYETTVPPSIRHFQSAIVTRIKVMASLDIAERRLPQDGRIRIRVGGNDLDLRVSILPSSFGESVTVRLLTSRDFLDLEHLGFFKKDLEYLESLVEKPHGIILLTGPTGSGKTTTLYAFLSKMNGENIKIITIEDPIEYQIRGITQVQVHPKIGLDFARGLRSMLRHDPDTMMVGEIRDLETAEIAIRVSLTGHLVFSTLHTNDSPGAVTRLLDMGLEPYLVASSVECIIAQRLVRLICEECKQEDKSKSKTWGDGRKPVYKGSGCERCNFTGYRSRTIIYEILGVDREIRELISQRVSANKIREKAIAKGMKSLKSCGWEKIHLGLTTPEEVMRVTMKEEEG